MAIVATVVIVSFGSFEEDANLKNEAFNLQSYLRLAQANATTGVKCGSAGGASWSIVITDRTSIKLKCQTQETPVREWTIKYPAQIDSIEGIGTLSCSSVISNPVTVTFSYLAGQVAFSELANDCLAQSTGMSIKVRKKEGSVDFKTITVSKGGSVDVQ